MSLKFILIYAILLIFTIIGLTFIINSIFSKNCLILQTENLLKLVDEWENFKKKIEDEKGSTIFKVEGCVKEVNFYKGRDCWRKNVENRFTYCMCVKTIDNPFEEKCIGVNIGEGNNMVYQNPYLPGEYEVEFYDDFFRIVKR